MADISILRQRHSEEEVLLLLTKAVELAKDKSEIDWGDVQNGLEIGTAEAEAVFDWLVDKGHATPKPISEHWVREGRKYMRNNLYPALENMTVIMEIGETRCRQIAQVLVKRNIIRIRDDFSFERTGRMASFKDLVRQLKVVSKKYRGRCEIHIIMRNLYVDPITAFRLAQYGEEHLGLIWKSRAKEHL